MEHYFFVHLRTFSQAMRNFLYTTCKRLQCRYSARHTRGFGVHSPYMYHFTQYVVYERNPFYAYLDIEAERKALLQETDKCLYKDGETGQCRTRTLRAITRRLSLPPKCAQLLYRVVRHARCRTVLEVGTSLGLTAAYLASPDSKADCVAIEPETELAEVAEMVLDDLQIKNVRVMQGEVSGLLPDVLRGWERLDFAFVDLHGDADTTWFCFEQCVGKAHAGTLMTIGQPYRTPAMTHTWERIKAHPQVTSSIDLGRVGLVFFNTDLHKQHYRMRL